MQPGDWILLQMSREYDMSYFTRGNWPVELLMEVIGRDKVAKKMSYRESHLIMEGHFLELQCNFKPKSTIRWLLITPRQLRLGKQQMEIQWLPNNVTACLFLFVLSNWPSVQTWEMKSRPRGARRKKWGEVGIRQKKLVACSKACAHWQWNPHSIRRNEQPARWGHTDNDSTRQKLLLPSLPQVEINKQELSWFVSR